MADAETVALFRKILDALTVLLPHDPEDVIERAAQAVLMETGRPVLGLRAGRIVAPQGCNLRAKPAGEIVGTIKPNVAVQVGQPEGEWTPVRVLCWVGAAMVKAEG